MDYHLEQPWLPFAEVRFDWDESFHDLMLGDKIRMNGYQNAIKEVIKKGDVVLDLGTGTGILSLMALEQGAERVYGIEMDPKILALAVDRIADRGYGAKFIPINTNSFDAILPEKVDVIISEIMGNVGDNEGFQEILKDAYDRFVKPDCRSIPLKVESFLVPVEAEQAHRNIRDRRIATLSEYYDINKLMKDRNLKSAFNLYYDTIIASESCLSAPQSVKEYSDRWQQQSTYSRHMQYLVEREGLFTGFKGYFVAELSRNVTLDISADGIQGKPASDSWKHAYLPVESPIAVRKGDRINLTFTRSIPINQGNLEQCYRWEGSVYRDGVETGRFDQCLDEDLLD